MTKTTEKKPALICEIVGEDAHLFLAGGEEITTESAVWDDLADTAGAGDAEEALRYVLNRHGVEFRKVVSNANRLATDEDLAAYCRTVYFESEADFADRDTAELYALWSTASHVVESERVGA